MVKLLSLFSRYHFVHFCIKFSIVFRSRKRFEKFFVNIFVPHSEGKNALNESITLGERESAEDEKGKKELQTMNDWMNVRRARFVRDDDIKNISYGFTRSKCRFFLFLIFATHKNEVECSTEQLTAHTVVNIYTLISFHSHCNAACIHVELIIIKIKFPHL